MSDEPERWSLSDGDDHYEVDAAGLEALRASLEDGKPRVIAAGWVSPSPRRVATEEAAAKPGREMVAVVCPSCKGRGFVARVVDSAHGPLFWADPAVSGQLPEGWEDDDTAVTLTRVAIEWARRAGCEGRVPSATEVVRVLLAWHGPTRDGEDLLCLARCRFRHGDLVADPAELLAAVKKFRSCGRRQTVRARSVTTG